MKLKFVILILFVTVLWEVPAIFDLFWSPLYWVLQEDGSLYEWRFRTQLDHYIAIWGMICAYNYPHYENWLINHVEKQNTMRKWLTKGCLAAGAFFLLYIWYHFWGHIEERREYNIYHPYVSFLPIFAYIILRNLTPLLRQKHSALFAW
jgi:hypothetical protein